LPLVSGISEAQTRTTPVGPDGKDKPAPFQRDPAVRSILRKTPARTNQPSAVDTTEAKPLIPRQVKASPATYLGRELRVAGQPTLKLDPATGKWTGTSDGMAVEASAEAMEYYQRMKPKGQRPVFIAELVRRGGDYVLLYKSGIEPTK
jgi:hypothetical protein